MDEPKKGDVHVAFCQYCFTLVVKDKMTEHWVRMHKDVKAADYL